jgi:hypothetical protein
MNLKPDQVRMKQKWLELSIMKKTKYIYLYIYHHNSNGMKHVEKKME